LIEWTHEPESKGDELADKWETFFDEAVALNPGAWWDSAIGLALATTDEPTLDRLSWMPLRQLREVDADRFIARAIEAARRDPRLAAMVIDNLDAAYEAPDHVPLYGGRAKAVRAIGLEVAVKAAARLAEQVAASGDWQGTDFWAYHLGGELGLSDPELGWEFLCRLVEVVSPDALGLVGAGHLEDFCWSVSAQFIARIEVQARTSGHFKESLGHVWPGFGLIPDDIYRRIRAAAGYAWEPPA
jgi:hypothetical protein